MTPASYTSCILSIPENGYSINPLVLWAFFVLSLWLSFAFQVYPKTGTLQSTHLAVRWAVGCLLRSKCTPKWVLYKSVSIQFGSRGSSKHHEPQKARWERGCQRHYDMMLASYTSRVLSVPENGHSISPSVWWTLFCFEPLAFSYVLSVPQNGYSYNPLNVFAMSPVAL